MRTEELYTEIGQIVVDSISEDWESAQLDIKRQEKYVSVNGTYEDAHKLRKQIDDANFGYLFSLKIHELYSLMSAERPNPWNKLRFILQPSGKFELDFIWDQEYQDEIDRLNKK